jgi:hypothetical protein
MHNVTAVSEKKMRMLRYSIPKHFRRVKTSSKAVRDVWGHSKSDLRSAVHETLGKDEVNLPCDTSIPYRVTSDSNWEFKLILLELYPWISLYKSDCIFWVVTLSVLITEAVLGVTETRIIMQESKSGRPSLMLLTEVALSSFVHNVQVYFIYWNEHYAVHQCFRYKKRRRVQSYILLSAYSYILLATGTLLEISLFPPEHRKRFPWKIHDSLVGYVTVVPIWHNCSRCWDNLCVWTPLYE